MNNHAWHPKPFWLLVRSITLAALLALIFTAAPALAQDAGPNFNSIDDPLNGEYELYTVDDLVVYQTKPTNNNTGSAGLNYILETANQTITSQSVLDADNPDCYLASGRQPQKTRVGRFFALPYDVMVTLLPNGETAEGPDCTTDPAGGLNMALHMQSTQDSANTFTPLSLSAVNTAVAMDDFDKDGFEDLFIMSDSEMLVATASNVTNRNAGMAFGPVLTIDSSLAAISDPATGDFNADGLLDVAWIDQAQIVQFATVCPGDVTGTVCAEKSALEIVLNPNKAGSTNINLPNAQGECLYDDFGDVALTAGDYRGNGSDGLVGIRLVELSAFNCAYYAYWYEFNSDFTVATGTYRDRVELVSEANTPVVNTYAQSAALGGIGPEQAVAALGATDGDVNFVEIVTVLTFDGNTMTTHTFSADSGTTTNECLNSFECPWVNGVALGRYEAVTEAQESNGGFGLQIATLRNDGMVTIYTVQPPMGETPADWTPKVASQTRLDASLGLAPRTTNVSGFSWFVAGDMQGRSAHLGPPTVVRITSHSQPSVILGAPPMHVDYVLPLASTATEWQVVNFSAIPGAFNSSYSVSETGGNQSSDTNRTSYTYASSKQGGGGFSFGLPDLPSIGGSIKTTTENKYETVNETYAFTQGEYVYSISGTTAMGDEIWYGTSDFNVYYYPVLGETACPADNSSCDPGQEQPLYVVFSGPTGNSRSSGSGSTTEWYQPVHEPGNIFSYPWNETMLRLQTGAGIDLLTNSASFSTGSDTTQSVQWSSGAGRDQTTGTTNSHSFDKAYSLTAGQTYEEGNEANLSGDLDYNNSSSIETLNKSSTSVGDSQGIVIQSPGNVLNPGEYSYQVQPYIFGRTPAAGTVDQPTLPQDIQTAGPLQAAFSLDFPSNTGSWWRSSESPYTQQIDVALNHPQRWTVSQTGASQSGLNCQATPSGIENCLSFNDLNPNVSMWNSEFYMMRGLFMTVGGVDGPQRLQATAGEDVVLQARVYNYSFKDMDADSTIHVRFYRQAITNEQSTLIGDSVLINQTTLTPLPGFNSDTSPTVPNWTTATATLDTTDLGDTFQVFWVVVWAEDGSGNLITELQGHGLSAKPGDLSNIGDVPLEYVTLDGVQKTFSNNVGFYHQKFYIAPATAAPQPTGDPVLEIQNPVAGPDMPQSGNRVIIAADILAQDAPAEAVHVRLYPDAQEWQAYEADPTLPQPRAFDVEVLPYIHAGQTGRVEVPYRPTECGTQDILIWATVGASADAVTATATVDNGDCALYFPIAGTFNAE